MGRVFQILVFDLNDDSPTRRWTLVRPNELRRVSRTDRSARLAFEATRPNSGIPRDFPISLLERLTRHKFSAYRPEITDLLWVGHDTLWVRRFDTEFDPRGGAGVWDVIDVTEARLAEVLKFAAGVVPIRVLGDRVFATRTDSLGVQTILVMRRP